MPNQSPPRETRRHRTADSRALFRYEPVPIEDRRVHHPEEEPVLGPYETRYLIEMGYTETARTVN